MRKDTLRTVWAATPDPVTRSGEVYNNYKDLRQIENANLQTDYSEMDAKAYGNAVSEMLWMRLSYVPHLQIGDRIYLNKPDFSDLTEKHDGDYEVKQVRPGYDPKVRRGRNPTVVELRRLVK